MKRHTFKLTGIVLLLNALVFLLPSWARPFTNGAGKVLEGEIITVGADSFVIEQLQAKKRITIPIASVIPADREFVAQWKKDNPHLTVTIVASKESGGRLPGSTQQRKVEHMNWKITVKNGSRDPLPPMTLTYTQIVETRDLYAKGKKKFPTAASKGTIEIPEIAGFGSTTVKTSKVEIMTVDSKTDKGSVIEVEKWADDLTGLNVGLYWGVRQVTTYSLGKFADMGMPTPKGREKPAPTTTPAE